MGETFCLRDQQNLYIMDELFFERNLFCEIVEIYFNPKQVEFYYSVIPLKYFEYYSVKDDVLYEYMFKVHETEIY